MEILTINWVVENPTLKIFEYVMLSILIASIISIIMTIIINPGKCIKTYFIICSIIFVFCMGISTLKYLKERNEIKIEAIVNDEIPLNGMYGKYEDMQGDGKLYTITYLVDRSTFDINMARKEAGCND